jgi:4-diphosphocytidyl-2C-methyl-D-erythritol kinase
VPFAEELRAGGAFRADLSGAGPGVYGLFHRLEHARATARRLRGEARTWVAAPVW